MERRVEYSYEGWWFTSCTTQDLADVKHRISDNEIYLDYSTPSLFGQLRISVERTQGRNFSSFIIKVEIILDELEVFLDEGLVQLIGLTPLVVEFFEKRE